MKPASIIFCRTVCALHFSLILHLLSLPPFFAQLASSLLHEAMSSRLAEAVNNLQASGALQLGEDYMHIHSKCENFL